MSSEFLEKQLNDLSGHIQKTGELIQKYRERMRFEADPRTLGRYRLEVHDLKELINEYEQDYEALRQKATQAEQPVRPEIADIGSQLQTLSQRADDLINGQQRIEAGQRKIHVHLGEVQHNLLTSYFETERYMMTAIFQKLDEAQLSITQEFVNGLESRQLTDQDVASMWAALEPHLSQRMAQLRAAEPQAADILKDPGLEARHRLKVAIPLIPILRLVEYEAEFELGTGFNLKSAWNKLTAHLRRNGEQPAVQAIEPGSMAEFLVASAEAIPAEEVSRLPPDGAAEHDHYIYDTPKRRES